MRGLPRFSKFDWLMFAEGKGFMSTRTSEWKHPQTGQLLGTKVEALITADETDYGSPEMARANLYEKVVFKVPHAVNIPLEVQIQPKGNVRATIYSIIQGVLWITQNYRRAYTSRKKV